MAPKGGKVAAFFAESIQGVGGSVQFPRDFIKRTADAVRAGGGLIVSDEVQTGFGRTGSNFWVNYFYFVIFLGVKFINKIFLTKGLSKSQHSA